MTLPYRWSSPLAWLCDFLGRPSTDLYNEATVLAQQLDSDTIQDLYEQEMTKDGYFTPISKEKSSVNPSESSASGRRNHDGP